MLLGGVAVLFLSLMSLSLPYRLLLHPEFVRARWGGNECYIIGERSDDLLLFCPTLDAPRNRVIRKDAERLERFGSENIFTKFAGHKEVGSRAIGSGSTRRSPCVVWPSRLCLRSPLLWLFPRPRARLVALAR